MDEKERTFTLPDVSGMGEQERARKCAELMEFVWGYFGCTLQVIPQWIPAPGGTFTMMIGMNVVTVPSQDNG
jgi:hypothetical protein